MSLGTHTYSVQPRSDTNKHGFHIDFVDFWDFRVFLFEKYHIFGHLSVNL